MQHIDDENYDVALELTSDSLRFSLDAMGYGNNSNGDLSGNAAYTIDLVNQVIGLSTKVIAEMAQAVNSRSQYLVVAQTISKRLSTGSHGH